MMLYKNLIQYFVFKVNTTFASCNKSSALKKKNKQKKKKIWDYINNINIVYKKKKFSHNNNDYNLIS